MGGGAALGVGVGLGGWVWLGHRGVNGAVGGVGFTLTCSPDLNLSFNPD